MGVIVLFALYLYNSLISAKLRVKEAFSQIDVQLKRRADLIPNLVEAVKGYVKHEKSVITEVTNARKALMGARGFEGKIKADGILESALGRLFAIAEAYPDLKANTTFIELQKELSTTEDRVAYARQHYNDSILEYNTLCTTLPGKFFAGIYGRAQKEYLKIAEAERKVVKVDF